MSFLVVFLSFSPNLVAAQNFVPCSGSTCSSCHFVQMANTIIVYLIGMMFVIFAVMMVSAGFGMITSGGSPDAHKSAKNKLMNSFIGLVIVLVGWLLVDTVMRGLLKNDGTPGGVSGVIQGFGPWTQVKCDAQTEPGIVRETSQNIANSKEYQEEATNITPPAGSVSGSLSHADAVAQLPADKFIVKSSGSCSDKNSTQCTSLENIKANTVTRIKELQGNVGVPFIITGGTEAGHADGDYSHGNGYKVDLKPVPELNSYIYKNFTKIGPTKYQDSNGNTYYRHEPDHWDVTITN